MDIVDSVKTVAGMVKKIGDIPLYNQIIALQTEIMDIVSQNLKLLRENDKLKKQVQELKKRRELTAKLKVHENAYYVKGKSDSYDGPFCMGCKDAKGKMIRLKVEKWGDDNFYLRCSTCTEELNVSSILGTNVSQKH